MSGFESSEHYPETGDVIKSVSEADITGLFDIEFESGRKIVARTFDYDEHEGLRVDGPKVAKAQSAAV